MRYELFLALKMIRGRSSKLSGHSSRTIIRIAVAGITIGIAVMILTLSIVGGFQKEIRQKVIGFGSHLQVSLYNPQNALGVKPLDINQDFIAPIKSEAAVKSVQPFAYKSGIVSANEEILGVMAKGVNGDFDWSFFNQNMVSGASFNWRESAKTDSIVISKSMLDKLNLELGQKVTMSFFQDEKERKRRFIIGGVYESGMQQFDGSIILCDIRHIQKLNGWSEHQVAGFEVVLNNFEDLDELDRIVLEHISYQFNTLKITDQFIDIFGWLELQDINVFIILSLMIVVSGINMISALLVLILERSNMIGLLKSMGARNRSIANIFLINAAYLIFLGLLFGNVIGLTLGWIQQRFEILKLDQANYYIDHVPVQFDLTSIVMVNIGSLVACLIMLIIPSMLVSRIDPIKSIRFN